MKLFNLDIIGQPPHLHIYTQLCLCYSVPDSTTEEQRQAAVDVIATGLKTLSQKIPWIAGKIIHEPSNEPGNSGTYKIAPWHDTPPLVVYDLRDNPSALTMELLQEHNFPMELLDENLVAPYLTIPGGTAGVNPDEPTAVFAVQMTHIEGGILLTFVGQHQVMDLAGQVQVMRLLNMVCKGEEIPEEELEIANRDRLGVIALMRDGEVEPVEQLGRQTVKTSPPDSVSGGENTTSAASSPVWGSFSFSAESLASTKAAALTTTTSKNVSTDDALTAFIFQSITRARSRRLRNDANTTCTLGRAVDSRRYLVVPKTYPGLLNNMVYHTHSLQETIDISLGKIASELRQAVDPATSQIGLYTRALASLLQRTPDKGIISMGANINPSCDLMLSSWAGAGVDCYGLDFGMGIGVPVAVRRPRFFPVQGLGYLLPKHPSGEVVLVVCLREDDMEVLKADGEWGRWAVWVG